MNTYKTPWIWAEAAKLRFDHLYKIAKTTDLAVKKHIISLVRHLLRARTESMKREINGGLIGSLIEMVFILPIILKPESKYAALLAKGVGDKRADIESEINKLEEDAEDVINMIPFLNISEIQQLAEDLMKNKAS